jgi:hypothetical protein
MQDGSHAYSMLESEFTERYGSRALRVNGGFWLAPRFSTEVIALMDQELQRWKKEWREDYWSVQTLLAVAFARLGGRALDPDRYTIGLGGHRSHFVVRHYPSPKFFRPRFFTEGIPAVLRSNTQSMDQSDARQCSGRGTGE